MTNLILYFEDVDVYWPEAVISALAVIAVNVNCDMEDIGVKLAHRADYGSFEYELTPPGQFGRIVLTVTDDGSDILAATGQLARQISQYFYTVREARKENWDQYSIYHTPISRAAWPCQVATCCAVIAQFFRGSIDDIRITLRYEPSSRNVYFNFQYHYLDDELELVMTHDLMTVLSIRGSLSALVKKAINSELAKQYALINHGCEEDSKVVSLWSAP